MVVEAGPGPTAVGGPQIPEDPRILGLSVYRGIPGARAWACGGGASPEVGPPRKGIPLEQRQEWLRDEASHFSGALLAPRGGAPSGDGRHVAQRRAGRPSASSPTRRYCTVLCCAVLCCAVLYCAVHYSTVLYLTVRTELYCALLNCTVLCRIVDYCTAAPAQVWHASLSSCDPCDSWTRGPAQFPGSFWTGRPGGAVCGAGVPQGLDFLVHPGLPQNRSAYKTDRTTYCTVLCRTVFM